MAHGHWNIFCIVLLHRAKVFDFNSYFTNVGRMKMNNMFRGLIAGGAAYKLGGGLISTILIFLAVFWLLGKC